MAIRAAALRSYRCLSRDISRVLRPPFSPTSFRSYSLKPPRDLGLRDISREYEEEEEEVGECGRLRRHAPLEILCMAHNERGGWMGGGFLPHTQSGSTGSPRARARGREKKARARAEPARRLRRDLTSALWPARALSERPLRIPLLRGIGEALSSPWERSLEKSDPVRFSTQKYPQSARMRSMKICALNL